MKKEYDVIVVGGGPAGGKCAFELAKLGVDVLLIERYKSFKENNFSSAGMLFETMDDFNLPKDVIASEWSNFTMQTSANKHHWESDKKIGVVLHFDKLKQYLAESCTQNGGTVMMGYRYESKVIHENFVDLKVVDIATKEKVDLRCKLVVDATGPIRKVMYDNWEDQPKMSVATGLEYLIEVPDEIYAKFKNELTFFLGEKWANMGYSWIFPMDKNTLKVGSGKIVLNKKEGKSIKDITENIIKEYIGLENFKLLESHGGSLRYSMGMKDIFYKNRVVAIGDAVSTVNPLGGEGIRYALENGELVVPYIQKFVQSNKNSFKKYERKWKRKYYIKWTICEALCLRVYNSYSDKKLESRMSEYKSLVSYEELIDNLFRFKLRNFKLKLAKLIFKKLLTKLTLKKQA